MNEVDNLFLERIKDFNLLDKVMEPVQAAAFIHSDSTIGCSGFASVGCPKVVLKEVARLGTAKNLTVLSGASCGDEVFGELSRSSSLKFIAPFNNNKDARESINSGNLGFQDIHLSKMIRYVEDGFWGTIDTAVIECCLVVKDGFVPTLAIGTIEAFTKCAKNVILEINTAYPVDFEGFHSFSDGTNYMFCPKEKICAIVFTNRKESLPVFPKITEVGNAIAENVLKILRSESEKGRIKKIPTVESGIGSTANAVLSGLGQQKGFHFMMYTEVLQDAGLKLLLSGVVSHISTAALLFSEKGMKLFFDNIKELKGRITICPQNITNGAAMIEDNDIIAMNTAVEVDIYGNVNSTHVMGSYMLNGIGGSGDFSRHARVSIFMTPSILKGGKISCIVPMVSHVDHTEHDVQFIVTEQGVADLRGKTPVDRAEEIINKCCHPLYRQQLFDYFSSAKKNSYAQHEPLDFDTVFSWHKNYLNNGTMILK